MFLGLFEALVNVVLETGLRELLAKLVAEKGASSILGMLTSLAVYRF